MPVANINGHAINYEDNGGDGPVILFSHGFLMDHTMFDAQVAAFGDQYRCIRWDERGFGATRTDAPFTYWDSADDAIGVLDHLGVESAIFAGMSQGGFLSLRAAIAHPDRVDALIMIDTEAGVDDAETLAGYAGMIQHWLSDEPLGEVGEFVGSLIIAEPDLTAEWIAKWEQRRNPDMEFAAGALLERDDITDQLAKITCPVLSFHGEEDQAISMERGEAVQAGVADGRGLIRVPGAAHAPNMTHPDIVNAGMADFLATL